MKHLEYIEGDQATENFEEGMKALFKVSKTKVAKDAKKQDSQRPEREPKRADEN